MTSPPSHQAHRTWQARALTLIFTLFALGLAACSRAPSPDEGPLVLAASSMQEAMLDAAEQWHDSGHPKPVVAFAASSSLARQLLHGAPADLFISANQDWMDSVEPAGLLRAGSRANLVGNEIVLIAPKGQNQAINLSDSSSFTAALGDRGRLAMADPQAVPAGRYGKASLENLGLWPDLSDRIAPADNVRAALGLVESGETPLGIVYATDAAAASDRVTIIARFPETSHPPIRYPLAVLAGSAHSDAMDFRDFLLSPQGQAIFVKHGFSAGRAE
ncbi:molybdate ABC transporter substrate-binding protein [Altericroceibacterium endophyticum]|uniref:Molybdate ABC transporter substrate-binding protein n=1 Tax=Altericroceibacterium endophyticum TaxID=1808508 RepID=A0A6I4T9U6_9SPHN|nr:molybdate ABC transporter substrate-binding protein [Altericroceibacterium endophyticum]MXO66640.1 molybdate ABC transporter substrate-binding protein [Altericroceibacterium endophyticum]